MYILFAGNFIDGLKDQNKVADTIMQKLVWINDLRTMVAHYAPIDTHSDQDDYKKCIKAGECIQPNHWLIARNYVALPDDVMAYLNKSIEKIFNALGTGCQVN